MTYTVQVALNNIAAGIDKLYSYQIEWSEHTDALIGRRVLVPFGRANKTHEAYVFSISGESSSLRLKKVKEVLDHEPLLTPAMLDLCAQMRDRYICSYMDAVRLMVPPGATTHIEKWVNLALTNQKELYSLCKTSKRKKKIVDALLDAAAPLTTSYLSSLCESDINAILKELEEAGALTILETIDDQLSRDKIVRFVRLSQDELDIRAAMEAMNKNSYVQKRMLAFLCENDSLPAADLVEASHGSYSAIASLAKKGLVEYFDCRIERGLLYETGTPLRQMPTLNAGQQQAADRIMAAMDEKVPHAFLLHGITGSGKTEVFMTAAQKALARGQSVIILVSEISLTPQLTNRFLERFGGQVAILHSRLSMGERYDTWRRIKEGEARVVIGARSAIFAPCENVGLIVLDEEHETSYKSENIPRYHAREIAFMRAKQSGAAVVMASATPSLESYYFAKKGLYELLELTTRYSGAALPHVEICDMTREMENGNTSLFSERLKEEIAANLARGEQTILFLNRRGFSGFVSCRSCGYVAKCPHCSISLTYHKHNDSLVCHYCGYTVANFKTCPSCFSKYIRYFGAGTQRVEEEVKKLFPSASVLRMDVDTTSKKGGHEAILSKFAADKIDILIGTQMVAKGLDFENVTLVGVIAADIGLNVDDFRASERTFCVLTQVAGRAGRGSKRGRSIIQTYNPTEPAIAYAKAQDYVGFYNEEILMRQTLMYPPFCRMVNLTISSVMENAAHRAADQIRKDILALRIRLAQEKNILQLLGPAQSSVFKVGNKYRYRILIKCHSAEKLTPLLNILRENHLKNKDNQHVILSIDKNPY